MKLVSAMLGAGVFGAAMTSAVGAYAADREFCQAYTQTAVRQAHEAREFRCLRDVEYNPARWSEDGRGHFDWCRSVPREAAQEERDIRTDHIRECRSRDRR